MRGGWAWRLPVATSSVAAEAAASRVAVRSGLGRSIAVLPLRWSHRDDRLAGIDRPGVRTGHRRCARAEFVPSGGHDVQSCRGACRGACRGVPNDVMLIIAGAGGLKQVLIDSGGRISARNAAAAGARPRHPSRRNPLAPSPRRRVGRPMRSLCSSSAMRRATVGDSVVAFRSTSRASASTPRTCGTDDAPGGREKRREVAADDARQRIAR